MNDDHRELLSRISGEVFGLLTMPIIGRVSTCTDGWTAAYCSRGLNFASSKEDALLLRELTAAGFVASVGGRTKGSSWRLTWPGVVATTPPDVTPFEMLTDLATLVEMEGPAGRRSGLLDDFQVVYGYRLAPAALDWIKGKDCEKYNRELGQAATSLAPLLMMGWVDAYTDRGGALWAVSVTPAGRAVLDDLPDLTQPCGAQFDFDSWATAYDKAIATYPHREIPPAAKNTISHRLSSGGAWEDYDKKTKAQLHAELKAAARIAKQTISDRQEAGRANHNAGSTRQGRNT